MIDDIRRWRPDEPQQRVRCAIYTRKSTDEGLDQEFNSLDAHGESAEAYILSQRSEGWVVLPDRYDDGRFFGGNMERPALTRLMDDIAAERTDCVVVYKVDRLSRSLLDFSKLVELLDRHKVSFVSVTQHFHTTDSMGRLTLNILLSFAQFEREITAERVRFDHFGGPNESRTSTSLRFRNSFRINDPKAGNLTGQVARNRRG